MSAATGDSALAGGVAGLGLAAVPPELLEDALALLELGESFFFPPMATAMAMPMAATPTTASPTPRMTVLDDPPAAFFLPGRSGLSSSLPPLPPLAPGLVFAPG